MLLETFITHYSACRRDKRDSLQQDPTHVLPATTNTPKLLVTRAGHQKSKSSLIAEKYSKLAQGAHVLL